MSENLREMRNRTSQMIIISVLVMLIIIGTAVSSYQQAVINIQQLQLRRQATLMVVNQERLDSRLDWYKQISDLIANLHKDENPRMPTLPK